MRTNDAAHRFRHLNVNDEREGKGNEVLVEAAPTIHFAHKCDHLSAMIQTVVCDASSDLQGPTPWSWVRLPLWSCYALSSFSPFPSQSVFSNHSLSIFSVPVIIFWMRKAMVGFTSLSQFSFTQTPFRSSYSFPFFSSSSPSSILKFQSFLIPRKPITLVVFADNNNGSNELKQEDKPEKDDVFSNGEKRDDSSKDRRTFFFNFNLGSLLDPDPDNVLALCLTGLLTWASVQVLWQLCFISLAILLAALKYSFIAALLVFILITLL